MLPREYDWVMSRLNRATITGFGLTLVGLLLSVSALAQIHGAPPSVTSMGFGGHAISGISPSVTSLGPRGFAFNPALPNSRPRFGVPPSQSFGGRRPHHHPRFPEGNVGYYAVPYYGNYDNGYYENGGDAANYAAEDEYRGGPTMFDRRGPGYVPRPPEPDRQPEANPAPSQAALEPSTPTVLVFKDGHQLEVENYAIVGATLYDLTEGHRRKVALTDLDLTATSKQNDDRGIDFRLPAGAEAN